jgi:predicted aspartyl protease
MPYFLERFVLPACAAFLISVIILNPSKLSRRKQVYSALAVIVLALVIGFVLQKSVTPSANSDTVHMETHGANSPNIQDNSGTVTINPRKEK